MENKVYRKTEIVGTSQEGVAEAIANGLARARMTLRHVDWFEVSEIRGYCGGDDETCTYQVTMKVGFRLEDPQESAEPGRTHPGRGAPSSQEA